MARSSPKPPASGRIAFVGEDRQVYVMDAHGNGVRPVTFAKVPTALSRWGSSQGRDSCSWPVWSPDGRWLCCFQSPLGEDQGGPALVVAVEVDGVEEQALVALEGELPIYAQWNAKGDKLAVLAQDQDDLVLWTCRLGRLGSRRTVDQGVPLFFSWAPLNDRLLVHVGRRAGRPGHVVLRDPDGTGEDQLMAEVPGSFCTPMFAGEHAVFAEARPDHRSAVCVWETGHDGHERARVLVTLDGLVAMVPHPHDGILAVGAAPVGDGTPYQGVWLVPIDGSPIEEIVKEPCLAFFFDPTGSKLLYVKTRSRGQGVTLHVAELATREHQLVARFWPSPDQLYYFQFFEQFVTSHPLVSPDGRTVLFSGYEGPHAGRVASPSIFAVDLSLDAPIPRVLGQGSFAVFSRS